MDSESIYLPIWHESHTVHWKAWTQGWIPIIRPEISEMQSKRLTNKLGQQLTIWNTLDSGKEDSQAGAGVRIHNMLTRIESNEDNGEFLKGKVRLCAKRVSADSQGQLQRVWTICSCLKGHGGDTIGNHWDLLQQMGTKLWKTDTKQNYFLCDMEDDVAYIQQPDLWPEPVAEGHIFLLHKIIYGTWQAASNWHHHISNSMENNGYTAMNSQKTIFMKCKGCLKGSKYIIHCLFVDDMMHIHFYNIIKDEILALWKKDFEITGGCQMHTFPWYEVEQTEQSIKIHNDHYVKKNVAKY